MIKLVEVPKKRSIRVETEGWGYPEEAKVAAGNRAGEIVYMVSSESGSVR